MEGAGGVAGGTVSPSPLPSDLAKGQLSLEPGRRYFVEDDAGTHTAVNNGGGSLDKRQELSRVQLAKVALKRMKQGLASKLRSVKMTRHFNMYEKARKESYYYGG